MPNLCEEAEEDLKKHSQRGLFLCERKGKSVLSKRISWPMGAPFQRIVCSLKIPQENGRFCASRKHTWRKYQGSATDFQECSVAIE